MLSRPNLEQFLDVANTLARGELIVALREPHRKLINLLRNHSAEQAQTYKEIEEAAALAELHSNENWGTF